MSESRSFAAKVTDVRLESSDGRRSLWQIALDRSEFQPGDTGELEACARSGARLTIPVLRVSVDEAGARWHLVEKPLNEGTEVKGTVLPSSGSLLHS